MTMNEIVTNSDAAKLLGVKTNTLNQKRGRLTETQVLTEGEHWLKDSGDGGSIKWTAEGIKAVAPHIETQEAREIAAAEPEVTALSPQSDSALSLSDDKVTEEVTSMTVTDDKADDIDVTALSSQERDRLDDAAKDVALAIAPDIKRTQTERYFEHRVKHHLDEQMTEEVTATVIDVELGAVLGKSIALATGMDLVGKIQSALAPHLTGGVR